MTRQVPITAALLESKDACPRGVGRFRQHFGEGPAPLTPEAVAAVAGAFDWDWAAEYLLSPDGAKAYRAAARAAYVAVYDPALADFRNACAQAFLSLYLKENPCPAKS